MLEAMTHFAIEPFAAFFALGDVPRSSDRPRLAQAYILRTQDSQLLAIHLSSLEKFWTGLIAALGADFLASDPRFSSRLARIEHYDELGSELDALFRTRSLQEWIGRLGSYDVPFAPINSVDAVVNDPQVRHLEIIVPVDNVIDGGRQAVRPPVQFDGVRADRVRPAPLLDQHGAAIRAAIAMDARWPEQTF
jgi:crotonobetainyl-CoA:carnitine CoA-transferase CaiB-like acyl-CoA transferase